MLKLEKHGKSPNLGNGKKERYKKEPIEALFFYNSFNKTCFVVKQKNRSEVISMGYVNTDDLQRALKSADSPLKIQFKSFCEQYNIVPHRANWGFIPPKDDVEKIVKSFNESLDKYGVCLSKDRTIPDDVFIQVVRDVKKDFNQFLDLGIKEKAINDLHMLAAYNKPIMWSYNEVITQGDRSLVGDSNVIVKQANYPKINNDLINSRVNMFMNIDPLHMVGKSARKDELSLHLQNVKINDIIPLGKIDYAIVTDDAIFVRHRDNTYRNTMVNEYQNMLRSQNIQLPEIGGANGFRAVLSNRFGANQEIQQYLSDPNVSHENKYQVIADCVAGMRSQGDYGTYCLHEPYQSLLFKDGEQYFETSINDVYPGMEVRCCYYRFEDMETGEQIDHNSHFKVLDVAKIKDDTILITDKGILSNRDIGQELDISLVHEQHHDVESIIRE